MGQVRVHMRDRILVRVVGNIHICVDRIFKGTGGSVHCLKYSLKFHGLNNQNLKKNFLNPDPLIDVKLKIRISCSSSQILFYIFLNRIFSFRKRFYFEFRCIKFVKEKIKPFVRVLYSTFYNIMYKLLGKYKALAHSYEEWLQNDWRQYL